ncbi:hypothetical protein MtrunA17_Chr6g0485161 [Medicago truncatula]|uniref:Transmembrane protein n=1 Tax=Medicago truncatula TaxID=3880 RepID=A0A396HND3_MEDTR|nr:hypothetical protein MtrunA17_Chr6g0485161 [Medicago truncatula]
MLVSDLWFSFLVKVASISRIYELFACLIALIEIGCYTKHIEVK